MDVAACPESSSSQPWSFKTGKTKADVERVPASANTSASMGLLMLMRPSSSVTNFSKKGAPSKIPIVSTPAVSVICAKPKGKYSVNLRNRVVDTSKPSENNKNRIPKSPSSTSALELLKTSNPCEPSKAPANKYPNIGVIPMDAQIGVTKTEADKKTSRSFPIESSTIEVAASGMLPTSLLSASPMSKLSDTCLLNSPNGTCICFTNPSGNCSWSTTSVIDICNADGFFLLILLLENSVGGLLKQGCVNAKECWA
mmetsp:Transcript_27607/g.31508  ORF Transcript_27607/g.31508 Transcript_27607/m.31508 type:complete len:255 (-) Transcript_27607:421-1185(-)